MYLMYNPTTEHLLGVTKSCYQNLGIPASLVLGNSPMSSQFTIDFIAPELVDSENLDKMAKPEGLVYYYILY
jgi:hypothetical protein